MQVHIEPLAAVLRVFDGDSNYGDPYEVALTLRYLDQTTVEILGLDKPITPAVWRAIRRHLESAGIHECRLKRNGRTKVFKRRFAPHPKFEE